MNDVITAAERMGHRDQRRLHRRRVLVVLGTLAAGAVALAALVLAFETIIDWMFT